MVKHANQIFALALLCCLSLSWAFVTDLGPCPRNIKTVQDFDAPRFLGRWYEYSKYPYYWENNAKCINANYGDLGDGRISVYNQQISTITGEKEDIEGYATVAGPGKLQVHFEVAPAPSDYWVLGTDYDNWAVTYSCSDFRVFHTTVVWILTREREPSAEYVKAAETVLKSNGISLQPLVKCDQTNCNN